MILALTMRNAKANGTDIKQKMLMGFAMFASKMKNIKKKVQKKEIIFILILNVEDAKRNLF